MPDSIPVDTLILRRLVRAGTCVILEVTVTYPHIPDADSPTTARFNEAYRSMAESFLAWADTAPAEEARASFAAMGSTAPYRFDRRILTCSMTAEALSQRLLTVTRTVTLKSRRGELTERTITAVDGWRIPELTAVKIPQKRIDDRLGEQA
jgi:hypothetical protein